LQSDSGRLKPLVERPLNPRHHLPDQVCTSAGGTFLHRDAHCISHCLQLARCITMLASAPQRHTRWTLSTRAAAGLRGDPAVLARTPDNLMTVTRRSRAPYPAHVSLKTESIFDIHRGLCMTLHIECCTDAPPHRPPCQNRRNAPSMTRRGVWNGAVRWLIVNTR
jgi:hypothetical protein